MAIPEHRKHVVSHQLGQQHWKHGSISDLLVLKVVHHFFSDEQIGVVDGFYFEKVRLTTPSAD